MLQCPLGTVGLFSVIFLEGGQSLSNSPNFWDLKVRVNISIDEKRVMENFIDICFAKGLKITQCCISVRAMGKATIMTSKHIMQFL